MEIEKALQLAEKLNAAHMDFDLSVRQSKGSQAGSNVPKAPSVALRIMSVGADALPSDVIRELADDQEVNLRVSDLQVL